jgi:hypothetical protein
MLIQASGTFTATAADLYFGLGFVPDWVKVRTLVTTDEERTEWSKNMRGIAAFGGQAIDDDGAITPIALGAGIAEYLGGDELSSVSTVYLGKRADNDMRDKGTGDVINAFTLDVPANRTGHFNAGVNTTHVGVGSIVRIGKEVTATSQWAYIVAITNDGDAANEVTLSKAIGSGSVMALGPINDFIGVPAGTITKSGFFLDSTAATNIASQYCMFEAGTYN